MPRVLACVLFSLCLLTTPARADGPTIVVDGEGDVEVVPNVASITIRVTSVDKDPRQAQAKNVKIARDLFDAMKKLGISEPDFGSSDYSFERLAFPDKKTGKINELGFSARNTVSVRVTDLSILPALIGEVVGRGATRIESLDYSLRDTKPYIDQARAMAFSRAREDAQKSAVAAGLTLGSVRKISIGGAHIPDSGSTSYYRDAGEMDVAPPEWVPPLTPGRLHVTYHVTMEYELKP